jgi:hypothetical protein
MENTEPIEKPSWIGRLLDLIQDHAQLAGLEWHFERNQTVQKMGRLAGAVFCAVMGWLFLQLLSILFLIHLGVPLYGICLIFMGIYFSASYGLFKKYSYRSPAWGVPFQGSREELSRSLHWIRQHFS